MSRISNTRQRTREAAARLVAVGHQPYKLTVDQIYAEIKQGSRTTINDELKLWKDDQAKTNALNAALPPEVANAMTSIWASAVEYGEKAFEQRREEVEGDLLEAQQRIQALEDSLDKAHSELSAQLSQLSDQQAEIEALRAELGSTRAAAEAIQARADMLSQQLETCQIDAEQRSNDAKAEYQQQLAELQKTMTEREQVFRTEIDKTTERLEGVQKHVMLQVTEAREITKRTETALSRATRQNEELSGEVRQLKGDLVTQHQHNEKYQADLTRSGREIDRLRLERESLLQQLATLNGKLEVRTEQIESLEQRAVSAEKRLETSLKQVKNVRKPKNKPISG